MPESRLKLDGGVVDVLQVDGIAGIGVGDVFDDGIGDGGDELGPEEEVTEHEEHAQHTLHPIRIISTRTILDDGRGSNLTPNHTSYIRIH